MRNKERLYCVIVFFKNSETVYYGLNDDTLCIFENLLNKVNMPYRVYLQQYEVNC